VATDTLARIATCFTVVVIVVLSVGKIVHVLTRYARYRCHTFSITVTIASAKPQMRQFAKDVLSCSLGSRHSSSSIWLSEISITKSTVPQEEGCCEQLTA